jgi:hypothetical protein
MKELVKDATIDLISLLTRFSFDLNGSTAKQLVSFWLARYPSHWVQLALVEALYQGRYKARSIEQILMLWQRRGYPLYHFNHEFERIIRGRFSRHLPMQALTRAKLPIASASPTPAAEAKPAANQAPTEKMPTEPLPTQVPIEQAQIEPLPSELLDRELLDREPSTDSDRLSASDREKLVEELRQVSLLNAAFLEESRLHLLSSAESIAFLELHPSEPEAEPDDSPAVARELPIQAFKPVAIFQSETITKMKELALATSRSPVEQIQQFVPTSAASGFYSKLKAVATERSAEERSADVTNLTSGRASS